MPHVNPVQIQKFLKGVDYPTRKETLIDKAKNMGADDNVCASLEQLPDEEFQTPADVSQAFGKLADQPERSSTTSGVNEFLAQALQDSLAEIELCELALQKTSNDNIKIFAQRMIDEHSQMGQEIERLAAKRNADLPKGVAQEEQSAMKSLEGLSGQDFDRQFIDHTVKDHENGIKVLQHYAQQEQDADIKAFAEKGAQRLGHHLKMAREIEKKLQA